MFSLPGPIVYFHLGKENPYQLALPYMMDIVSLPNTSEKHNTATQWSAGNASASHFKFVRLIMTKVVTISNPGWSKQTEPLFVFLNMALVA